MSISRNVLLVVISMLLLQAVPGEAFADKPEQRPGLRKSEVTDNKIVLEYQFDQPEVSKSDGYDQLRINGLETMGLPGEPILPARPVKVSVPYGKKVKKVNVVVLESVELPGSYFIEPGQEPYPLSYTGKIEKTKPAQKIYGKSKQWPGVDYQPVGAQSKRGYQIFMVNLLPVQYNPVTGKISYASKMRLEIDLTLSDVKSVLKPTRKTKAGLGKKVDNPETLLSYPTKTLSVYPAETLSEDPAEEPSMYSAELSAPITMDAAISSLLSGGPYQHVIITDSALEAVPGPNNFQALRDARIAEGISSTIITTEWIYANYDPDDYDPNRHLYSQADWDDEWKNLGYGNSADTFDYDLLNVDSDHAISIRMFLIDAYQTWGTEYALLGGTTSIVPTREFTASYGMTPVDMYYGYVDPPECTFDYDQDGLYGESTDSIAGADVDLLAEIYVGRASVENATELRNFINKTLTYDSAKGDYLSNVSMIGEALWIDVYPEDYYGKGPLEEIRLGGDYDGNFSDGWHSYFTYGFENYSQLPISCFDTSNNLYDQDGIWSYQDLIDLMNNGVHILNHLGHAGPKYDMKLYTPYLSSLSNTDYFFTYSQGCLPGSFDQADCFAEEITSMDHGAFAVIMNAREGLYGVVHRFNRQFWDTVLGEGKTELGRANQDSKEDLLWDISFSAVRFSNYELNLFGDPAQKLKIPTVCNTTQQTGHSTIQDAIDDANNGDTILVDDGFYAGAGNRDIDFYGKSITLRSLNGPEKCIIDAQGASSVFNLNSTADYDASIIGFTITGGDADYGGGINVAGNNGNILIEDCVITSNTASYHGGAIYSSNNDLTINNSIIRDNDSANGGGGGITFYFGSLNINNSIISDNSSFSAGGGIFAMYVNLSVGNSTIVYNESAISVGGGIFLSSGNAAVKNSILWGNIDSSGNQIYGSLYTVSYSNIQGGYGGTGNFDTDPLFVDEANGDYHLLDGSPCINAGDPAGDYSGQTDIDGEARVLSEQADIGADEHLVIVYNEDLELWYQTIQGAIDEAVNGDTLVVSDGTHTGDGNRDINFLGKSITLQSANGPENCILDAQSSGTDTHNVFNLNTIQSYDASIVGFTITGGHANSGSGITITSNIGYEPNILVEDCIITANTAISGGAGIFSACGNLTLSNCTISNNDSAGYGGGIVSFNGQLSVGNSVISENTANDGGAIFYYSDFPMVISNCTIADNVAANSGGGICMYYGEALIANSIVWGNVADIDDQIYCANGAATINVNFSDIEGGGYAGTGNMDSDPLFVNEANGDYHLLGGSPCINAGDPAGDYTGQTDIDGDSRVSYAQVDMGADEYLGSVYNADMGTWYLTIQGAIDEAVNGDTIVVSDGTHTGDGNRDINFYGKSITLQSANGPESCIIDAQGTSSDPHSGFNLTSTQNSTVSIRGFTITGGYAEYGGGIEMRGIYGASGTGTVTVEDCIISQNLATQAGGGICSVYNNLTLMNCTMQNNACLKSGGGVNFSFGQLNLSNCLLSSNFAQYSGGGISGGFMNLNVDNCTFVKNGAIDTYGGGIYVGYSGGGTLSNSIFWGNTAPQGAQIMCNYGGTVNVSYTDIQGGGYAGTGNMNSDPLFVDEANGDYHLSVNSPCINAGDPAGDYTGQTDIDGEPRVFDGQVDMGADEIQVIALGQDGMVNSSEIQYVDSTATTSSDSFIAVTSRPTGDGVVLEWLSLPNCEYRVLWTDSLANEFQPVGPVILYPQNSYTGTVSSAVGFYKVEELLQ